MKINLVSAHSAGEGQAEQEGGKMFMHGRRVADYRRQRQEGGFNPVSTECQRMQRVLEADHPQGDHSGAMAQVPPMRLARTGPVWARTFSQAPAGPPGWGRAMRSAQAPGESSPVWPA